MKMAYFGHSRNRLRSVDWTAGVKKPVCKLCDQEIPSYRPLVHHLVIEAGREVDICSDCLDKIRKMQQTAAATLFPTAAAKGFLNRPGRNRRTSGIGSRATSSSTV